MLDDLESPTHGPDHPDDDDLRPLFAALPRECEVDPAVADRLVRRLRDEGFLRPRVGRSRWRWAAQLAAAIVLLALGGLVGARVARRGSLEEQLERRDLSLADRVLLLQRAGSAYVRAAQAYADATVRVDSTAVEVASHVLLGAADAVARRSLDAGLSARLTSAMQPSAPSPVTAPSPLTIWF